MDLILFFQIAIDFKILSWQLEVKDLLQLLKWVRVYNSLYQFFENSELEWNVYDEGIVGDIVDMYYVDNLFIILAIQNEGVIYTR